MKELAEKHHAHMVEKIVEFDDKLMERYLNGETKFSDAELKRRCARRPSVQDFPVLCASSYKNKGVQPCSTRSASTAVAARPARDQGHDIYDNEKVVERHATTRSRSRR